jgi:hypothetical protein
MRRATRAALVAVDAFAAGTAIGGGIALATGAERNRFPAAWLRGTPFRDYVIPGLLLAGVVGGSAAVATVATLRRPRLGGPASLAAGVIMMGWITGEVLMLRRPLSRGTLWEMFYFAAGLMMVALGSADWRSTRPRLRAHRGRP